jgi:hypothetical protein
MIAETLDIPGESLGFMPAAPTLPGVNDDDASAIERFPALYRAWNNIAANVRDADTRLMQLEARQNTLPALRRVAFVAQVLAPFRLAVKRAKDAELSLRRQINAVQTRLMAAAEEAFRKGQIGPADVPGLLWGQGLTKEAVRLGLIRPTGSPVGNAVPAAPVGNQNAPVGVDGLGVLPVVAVAVWTGAQTIARSVAVRLAATSVIRWGLMLGLGTVTLAFAVRQIQAAISDAQTASAQANNAARIGEAAAARIAAGGSVGPLPPGTLPADPNAPSGLFDRVGAGLGSALPLLAVGGLALFAFSRKGRT